jgi:hypothetical protein
MICVAAHAERIPPAPEIFAEWKTLPQDLFSRPWTFWRYGRPVGDGGSIFTDFRVSDNQVVSVVAAHTSYWSKSDHEKSRQPYFIYIGLRMHRFDPGTAEEQAVNKAITDASVRASAKTKVILKHLLEQIESRKPLFNPRSEQAVPSDGHKPSSHVSPAGPTAPADAH